MAEILINAVSNNIPMNTVKSKHSIWKQFSQFLAEREYALESHTTAVVKEKEK